MTRRSLQGLAESFLGRFCSRYSSYRGYWLLGFLVEKSVDFDLLGAGPAGCDDIEAAAGLVARAGFADQLRKNRLPESWLSSAQLGLESLEATRSLMLADQLRLCRAVRIRVRLVSDRGSFRPSEPVG